MNIDEIIQLSRFVDQPVNYSAPSITIQGKTIANPGNFITLTGLPKNYKSTVMAFFVASALTGQSFFDINVTVNEGGHVCIIDTEQALPDFYKQVQRLKKITYKKELPTNFQAFTFRKYDPPEILQAIEIISQDVNIKFMILDNLTELVMNPNDMIEAKKVIQLLKKITATRPDLTILCLLHLGKTNFNSLGNLGSYADRAAQSVIKCSYDEPTGQINIEPTYTRSDMNFKPFTIRFNPENGNFESGEALVKEKSSRKFVLMNLTKTDHDNRLRIVFKSSDSLTYSELVEDLKKIYGVGSNITKQQIIPYLVGNEFVNKSEGLYTLNQ